MINLIKNIYHQEYLIIYVILAPLLLIPLFLVFLFTAFSMPWREIYVLNFCTNTACVEAFSSKYLGAFSWYGNWLSVSYNITTILGVAIAVLTYHKTKQSQEISNHFSNVELFKNYISEEISKSEWLSAASFDLMIWYLKIYPRSKIGDMQCSLEYTKSINSLAKCLSDSNNGTYDQKKIGYQFSKHQISVKKIYRSLGIKVKETNRLSFYEIEGEILDLIDKVNKTFPNLQEFDKFPTRSYK